MFTVSSPAPARASVATADWGSSSDAWMSKQSMRTSWRSQTPAGRRTLCYSWSTWSGRKRMTKSFAGIIYDTTSLSWWRSVKIVRTQFNKWC
jgi:hypothetical protein